MNTNRNNTSTTSNSTVYLVTSGAGFMGGIVVRKLLERGEKVRAFVLKGDPAVRYVPDGAEIFEGDVCDKESLERFFTVPKGVETVCLHIASLVALNPEYDQKVMDVNVGGCQNVIDCCVEHSECRKLVYVSSTGAIPELPKGQKIKEVDRFDPARVVGCYSKSKAIATQLVLDAVRDYELNACVVHPSGILGPGDRATNEVTSCILRILNGELPAGIDGSFNLADARDLADGIIAAADKGRMGECYILGNDEVTFRDFVTLLAEEAGVRPVKHFLPIWAANAMARLMEAQAKRKGTKPLMTTFSVYNLARNNDFDSSKAKRELGYVTRPYRETIRDQIAWLRETGKIGSVAAA
ncbi:MAG: NAD-dependent epimerase/dehydratase family protein [Ruminococcaceae bacterium]|nr:NAD-dependent epimerase/dehydratase family protein [Oscillospiraceae bacterium]